MSKATPNKAVFRVCNKCGDFEEHTVKNNGKVQAYCRKCNTEYQKKWYADHKEQHDRKVRIAEKARRLKIREVLQAIKAVPCADCGIKYPYYVMQFDHLREKDFVIATASRMVYSLDRILEETEKCEVVCANCHAERTHQRRED